MRVEDRLSKRLLEIRKHGLERRLPTITHRSGPTYQLDGRPVVGFSSNDYLGLADHPALVGAAHRRAGATASRLICGDEPEHRSVESALARLCSTEDAVLFPSGFQLNVGTLPSLVERSDLVFSDQLNHASLIDGLRLARARVNILPHLTAPQPTKLDHVSWWVTESIFSMDGDTLSRPAIARFREQGGWTYVDDAHGFGLFDNGLGYVCPTNPSIYVATLSKAYGCAGAFLASSRTVCSWVRTRTRSFVFSTGVSPLLATVIERALAIVRGAEGDERRRRLWDNVEHLAKALGAPTPPRSPIFPILVGSNHTTVKLAAALLNRGWHVQPIRPPTVPDGTARLRVTVTAGHTRDQLNRFAADLHRVFHDTGTTPQIVRGQTAPV